MSAPVSGGKKALVKQADELVTIDELGERYAMRYAINRKKGYPQIGPHNHFNIALLLLLMGRFSYDKKKQLWRVPKWSDFHSANITTALRECGLSEKEVPHE